MVIVERLESKGNCEANYRCEIILERGWGSYRRVCNDKEVTSGRFDKGRNVELFGNRILKSEFYKDPAAERIAARIPPPPASLKDNANVYKARYEAIPAALLELVRAGRPIPMSQYDPRDLLDAVIEIDSKNWSFNTYIPGSLSDVKSETDAGSVVLRATIVINPVAGHNWVSRSVSVKFVNGYPDCIKYWNSLNCSVNFEFQVNPNADRRLTAEQDKCISVTVGEYLASLPRQCIVMDVRRDLCIEEGPQEFEPREYRQIENTCDKEFQVALTCPIFRTRLTLPPKSKTPAPGFSMLNCRLERLPRG